MKIRNGFVSNSSSSSFVILLEDITAKQLRQIQWHGEDDPWDITVNEETVTGSTFMDNFGMHGYLESIKVPMDKVRWDN